jgi:iron complex transport system substrate-binding protein
MVFAWAAGAGPALYAGVPENAPRVVTDEVGRQVKLPAEVRRIVSLAPNITETLYMLGAESLLVADTNYCDEPPQARLKPHVGMPLNPSLEAIVAMKPDLVLATTAINRRATVDALDHLGLAVYSTDPHTVDGMLSGVERLADVIGMGARGHELVAGLQERLRKLDAAVAGEPRIPVLFVVWEEPLISVGPKTFIADALQHAGAESVIKSKQAWPSITPEEIVRLRPDYLIYAADHGTGSANGAQGTHDGGNKGEREGEADQAPSIEALRKRIGWRDLPAVKEGHLAVISDEIDRPSPGLVDAIEDLARKLHPAVFGSAEGCGEARGCSR